MAATAEGDKNSLGAAADAALYTAGARARTARCAPVPGPPNSSAIASQRLSRTPDRGRVRLRAVARNVAAMSTTLCDMGLLDDAIREHLDLKRRRGADPTEVERSEREALGPVRRTPERVPGDDSERDPGAAPEVGAAPGTIYDDGLVSPDEPGEAAFAPAEPDVDDPAAFARTPEESHPIALDHSTLPGPVSEDDEPSWSYDEPAAGPEPKAEPDEDLVPPPHRADSARLDDDADHTAEYDVAAALDSEHRAAPPLTDVEAEAADERSAPAHADPHEHPAVPGEDEDVLEETPEFLQDTPDHDRLWFEQRPPKDFDFDG